MKYISFLYKDIIGKRIENRKYHKKEMMIQKWEKEHGRSYYSEPQIRITKYYSRFDSDGKIIYEQNVEKNMNEILKEDEIFYTMLDEKSKEFPELIKSLTPVEYKTLPIK